MRVFLGDAFLNPPTSGRLTSSSLKLGQPGQSQAIVSGFPLTRIRGHRAQGKEATREFRQDLSLPTPWSLKKRTDDIFQEIWLLR